MQDGYRVMLDVDRVGAVVSVWTVEERRGAKTYLCETESVPFRFGGRTYDARCSYAVKQVEAGKVAFDLRWLQLIPTAGSYAAPTAKARIAFTSVVRDAIHKHWLANPDIIFSVYEHAVAEARKSLQEAVEAAQQNLAAFDAQPTLEV